MNNAGMMGYSSQNGTEKDIIRITLKIETSPGKWLNLDLYLEKDENGKRVMSGELHNPDNLLKSAKVLITGYSYNDFESYYTGENMTELDELGYTL